MIEQDKEMEDILRRYRPAGPSAELRGRVLAQQRRARIEAGRVAWAFRAGIAAAILAAIFLNVAADRITSGIAAIVGTGTPVWTEDAEAAAQMLNGDGAGRRYVAMMLTGRPGPPPDSTRNGDMR